MKYNIATGVQRTEHNLRKFVIGISATMLMAGAAAFPAVAAPGDNGNGYGGCVDNFYGNATNPRESGHGVLPSQSPGPFVNTGYNEPPRNDRTRGASVGDVNQFTHDLGLNGGETKEIICTFP
jgi:hypothetical protein